MRRAVPKHWHSASWCRARIIRDRRVDDTLREDDHLRDRVIEQQRKRLEDFMPGAIQKRLESLLQALAI